MTQSGELLLVLGRLGSGCSTFRRLCADILVVNQIMPKFVSQLSLCELRERHSRIYSWQVFILSYRSAMAGFKLSSVSVFGRLPFTPPLVLKAHPEGRGLVLLFIVQFYIYAGSMAQMVVSALSPLLWDPRWRPLCSVSVSFSTA